MDNPGGADEISACHKKIFNAGSPCVAKTGAQGVFGQSSLTRLKVRRIQKDGVEAFRWKKGSNLPNVSMNQMNARTDSQAFFHPDANAFFHERGSCHIDIIAIGIQTVNLRQGMV